MSGFLLQCESRSLKNLFKKKSFHRTVLQFLHNWMNEESGKVATVCYLRLHAYGNVL